MQSSFLFKKYILVRSENFDAYMQALGVGLTLRKMGNTVCSQCLLTKNDDNIYSFWLKTPYRCCKISFKLDIPFTEITIDNRVVKTICSLDGNIFVQEQRAPGLKPTRIVREYRNSGGELIATMYAGDVKAVRYYVDTKETAHTLDDKISVKQQRSLGLKRTKTVRKYRNKGAKLIASPSVKGVKTADLKAVEIKKTTTEQLTSDLKAKKIVEKSIKTVDEAIASPLVEDIKPVKHNLEQKVTTTPVMAGNISVQEQRAPRTSLKQMVEKSRKDNDGLITMPPHMEDLKPVKDNVDTKLTTRTLDGNIAVQKQSTPELKPSENDQKCPIKGDEKVDEKPFVDTEKYSEPKPPKKKSCCVIL